MRQAPRASGRILIENVVDVSLRSGRRLCGWACDSTMDRSWRADLYIDCTGIENTVARHGAQGTATGTNRHWLPCDSRRDPPLQKDATDLAPCAGSHGTLVRLADGRTPLAGAGTDVGYAFFQCTSRRMTKLRPTLLAEFPGAALNEPRFSAIPAWGDPRNSGKKNCLVLAERRPRAAGIDGLLHLRADRHCAAAHLVSPVKPIQPHEIDEYNRLTTMEYERIRDFSDSAFQGDPNAPIRPFWEQCRDMAIPDTLRDQDSELLWVNAAGSPCSIEEALFGGQLGWPCSLAKNCLPTGTTIPLWRNVSWCRRGEGPALLRMRSMIREGVETMTTPRAIHRKRIALATPFASFMRDPSSNRVREIAIVGGGKLAAGMGGGQFLGAGASIPGRRRHPKS